MNITVRMLDPIEEYELIIRVYTSLSKDKKAREKLFRSYIPLARKEASKFNNMVSKRHVNFDDLFSEACIGLLMAIDKFDPTRCQRLSPVARIYIKDALRVYMMNNTGVGIKLSQSSNARKIYFGVTAYCRENNISPPFTSEQRSHLAKKLNTTEDSIILIEDLRSSNCALETVADKPSNERSPEEQYMIKTMRETMINTITPFFTDLEKKLFTARYIDDEDVTLEEFAEANNVPYAKARSISTHVIKVLKSFSKNDYLVGLIGDRNFSSTRPLAHQV